MLRRGPMTVPVYAGCQLGVSLNGGPSSTQLVTAVVYRDARESITMRPRRVPSTPAAAEPRIHCRIDSSGAAWMHVSTAARGALYRLMTWSAAESMVDFECDSVMIT